MEWRRKGRERRSQGEDEVEREKRERVGGSNRRTTAQEEEKSEIHGGSLDGAT